MRADEVDTLIDQLEDFIKAVFRNESNDAADHIIYTNMKESLKEYICTLAKIKPTIDVDKLDCPECGSKMIERKNRQSGNIFYGCKKYPDCKGTRDEEGLSREERATKDKPEVKQQEGFGFKRQPWNESGPS